jgi:CheY-like chemotaxis protein
MDRKRVLLLGDCAGPEFGEVVVWLRQQTELTVVATADEALRHLQASPPPAAVLLAQARPGRFTWREVEQLHAASPVSRLVALLGTWCEGEPRSGHPWPGVIRVYWHQWRARLAPELGPGALHRPVLWGLPRTAPPAEQWAAAVAAAQPPQHGLVAIRTRSWTNFDGLSTACRQVGYATVWLPPEHHPHVRGVAAVIWDGSLREPTAIEDLHELTVHYHPAPLVAVADFVRCDDYERALAAGVASVIAKPFLLNDLLDELSRDVNPVIGSSRTSTAGSSPWPRTLPQ